jgi:dipeptidase E
MAEIQIESPWHTVNMKLYLSSSGLGNQPAELLELVGRPGRAGLVFNAQDMREDQRLASYDEESGGLAALGFQCEELDLRTYFQDFTGLCLRMSRLDLIWVIGGNTFVVARAMSQARFGEAIRDPLTKDQIVYGGYSAGACVVGPDLNGCHLMDTPGELPIGYDPTGTATTLELLPWRIIPHWRSDHEEAPRAELAVEHLLNVGLPFQTLRDGATLVVDTSDHE